jgi:hypothetical protein
MGISGGTIGTSGGDADGGFNPASGMGGGSEDPDDGGTEGSFSIGTPFELSPSLLNQPPLSIPNAHHCISAGFHVR